MCLSHFSTLATFVSTWHVIIRVYPTSLPLPPSYQLDLSSYVSIPPLHPCHLLINLICRHNIICLSHIYTLANFLPTSSVIIRIYPTFVALSPLHQLDMLLSHISLPMSLLINLICHHMSLSHLFTFVTSYQLDLSPYVTITLLYLCHLRINLINHHMLLSHLLTFATSVSA